MTRSSALLSIVLATTAPALADPAGFAHFTVFAPHHGREVTGVVWYPAGPGGHALLFADSAVFHGTTVVEEAPVAPGHHPVVLLSHGMGGNVRSLGWLASALAERGAIIVAVNHPNSTFGDFDLSAAMHHGTRAQDLSLALDHLVADPVFARQLDPDRVLAAGFSFGGWTALSLGGAKADLAGYRAYCDAKAEMAVDCSDLAKAGVALEDFEPEDWDASFRDPRVSGVVAIDPGLVWGLTPEDVAGLSLPVHLIGLGSGMDRLLATDFDASGFADLVPGARIDRFAKAFHFTALPLCKPGAEAILAEEKDDPVCTDPAGTDRAAVHQAIIDRVAANLGLNPS
jgi:predicted dienelactone hydrolase